MIELSYKRSYNAKHYLKDNGELVMEAHVGHIYFKNGDSFEDIDWTLDWNETKKGWEFKTHSFHPFLPEYADEWVEFRDVYQDKDQTIKYKAVASHVAGRLVMPEDIGLKESSVNCVIYDDAFGEGIDYILYFTRSTLKKVVRIREGSKRSEDMSFDFEVVFPQGKAVKRGKDKDNIAYELDVYNSKDFDTDKQTMIGDDPGDGKEWNTYLRGFKCWDGEKSEKITVRYLKQQGKTVLRKIVPKSFLDASVGDVFTDTTTSYYAGAGDGYILGYYNTSTPSQSAWDSIHDSANPNSGNTLNVTSYTATNDDVGLRLAYKSMSNGVQIGRADFPIDTSGIDDAATISAAEFDLYASFTHQSGSDTIEIGLVQTSQASTSSITSDDFDQCGSVNSPTEGASRLSFTTGLSAAYRGFTLNSTGLGWISKTGYTKIGVRTGRDMSDTLPTTGEECRFNTYFSESTGSSSDPYLSVTYTTGSSSAVKTYNGLAKASVKTVNGLAIASVKTKNGLA